MVRPAVLVPPLGVLLPLTASAQVGAHREITSQLIGLDPSFEEFDPYLAQAQEYDIPVFIRMGPGLPGTSTSTVEALAWRQRGTKT